ncbi:MAG: R.RsaI endonuclease [Promethearchaeota archaeon CR_4]|nr:MAG: R.RsaI endonuclease [Candidatus Lokiarchaeota archaeon CR_4]
MSILHWDIHQLVRALNITEKETDLYFKDGRRISFLVERRIAHEVLHGSVATSEGASYDVLDKDGGKWEIRSISKGGIYFYPSYMVGSGRHFEETGFQKKLDQIKGYIVVDIEDFPDVHYWIIPTQQVREWWISGELGVSTRISHQKAMELIKSL